MRRLLLLATALATSAFCFGPPCNPLIPAFVSGARPECKRRRKIGPLMSSANIPEVFVEHGRDVSRGALRTSTPQRRSVYVEGISEREAAQRFGLARETMRKMLRYATPPVISGANRCAGGSWAHSPGSSIRSSPTIEVSRARATSDRQRDLLAVCVRSTSFDWSDRNGDDLSDRHKYDPAGYGQNYPSGSLEVLPAARVPYCDVPRAPSAPTSIHRGLRLPYLATKADGVLPCGNSPRNCHCGDDSGNPAPSSRP